MYKDFLNASEDNSETIFDEILNVRKVKSNLEVPDIRVEIIKKVVMGNNNWFAL